LQIALFKFTFLATKLNTRFGDFDIHKGLVAGRLQNQFGPLAQYSLTLT